MFRLRKPGYCHLMSNQNDRTSEQTIHAINLRKFLHASDTSMPSVSDDWLILGHFDSLSITDIGSVSKTSPHMLEQVWQDFCNWRSDDGSDKTQAGSYRHVLYMLPTDDEVAVAQLAQNNPFMFITRICKSNRYETIGQEQSMNDTVKAIMGSNIQFLCYPPLGLSDLILVMYSNSLEKLMKKVEELLFCPYIGDTYTYCCVSKRVLESPEVGIATKDTVPLISMRLAVRNTKKAEQRIKCWRSLKRKQSEDEPGREKKSVIDEAYVVTGTADINLLIRNISSYDFVQFLQEILMDSDNHLWDAFDDLITRLGISLPENRWAEKPCVSCKLDCKDYSKEENILCDVFMRENEHLRNLTRDTKASWVKPLMEMMNSFIYLSKNRVLDQLCYVLLSSVQGFAAKLQENRDKLERVTDLYKFVDGLAFVEEHTIRQEIQLILHPETRPMLFSLPVNTIESYLTFIDLCADFLQRNDPSGQKKDFFFLIVPCLCEKVTVCSLLYKQEENSHLLYIRVPLEHCYSPKEVVQALAHEIGHYSGESPRNRDKRFKMLLWCCAYFFCERLGIDLKAGMPHITDRLLREIPETDRQFMKTIEPCLETACLTVIHDESFIYSLRDKVVRLKTDLQSRLAMQTRIDDAYEHIRETDGIHYVIDVMKEVQMLSQECYADIAMLSLLDVTALDYICLIWKRRNSGLEKRDEEAKRMSEALLLERISLAVLVARDNEVDRLSDQAKSGNMEGEVREWLQMVVRCCRAIREKQRVTDDEDSPIFRYLHPPGVIAAMLRYLESCYAAMPKKKVTQEDEIDKLYCSLVGSCDDAEKNQREAIGRYRSKLVAWSIDNEAPKNSTHMEQIISQFEDGSLSAEDAVEALTRDFQISKERAESIIKAIGKL